MSVDTRGLGGRYPALAETYGDTGARLIMHGDFDKPPLTVLGVIMNIAVEKGVPLATVINDLANPDNRGGRWYQQQADKSKARYSLENFYRRSSSQQKQAADKYDELLYLTTRAKWNISRGTSAASLQKVMLAAIEFARNSSTDDFRASDDSFATAANMEPITFKRACFALQRLGFIEKLETGRTGIASKYRLAKDLHEKITGALSEKIAPYTTYKEFYEGNNSIVGNGANLSFPAPANLSCKSFALSHPAFKSGTGLSGTVYGLLRHDAPRTPKVIAEVTGMSLRRAQQTLKALGDVGLAGRTPSGWLRIGGIEELDRVADETDARKAQQAREARIQAEGQRYRQIMAEPAPATNDDEPDLDEFLTAAFAEVDNFEPDEKINSLID